MSRSPSGVYSRERSARAASEASAEVRLRYSPEVRVQAIVRSVPVVVSGMPVDWMLKST
jgi:hypothetical protein